MKRLFFSAAIVCMVLWEAPSAAQETGDWQFWNTDTVEAHWKGPWYMTLEEEFRMGENVGKLIYEHTDAGIIYKAADWVDFGLNFRYIFRKDNKTWEKEYRPHFNVTFYGRWNDFAFSNRSRVEHRNPDRTKNAEVYRNKTEIKMLLNWTRFNISPYVSEEIFNDFDQTNFNYQRISGGIEFTLIKNLEGEIYYLWQDSKGRLTVGDTNVIGTKLELKF